MSQRACSIIRMSSTRWASRSARTTSTLRSFNRTPSPPRTTTGIWSSTNNGNQLFNAGLLNNTATYDTGKIAATAVEQVSWSASLQVTIGGFWTTHTDTATPSFSFQYKVTEV